MTNATQPEVQDATSRTLRERLASTVHATRVRMSNVQPSEVVDSSEERLNEGVENVREALHNSVDFLSHLTSTGVTKGAEFTRKGVEFFFRK